MKNDQKTKRDYSQEYKKRVKFSPLFRTCLKSETRDFMLLAGTSGIVKNQGDVVIKHHNIGKALRAYADKVISREQDYNKVFPKTLPRYRDNALLDVELCSLTLASYQLQQGELEAIPFTLLLSDKTYSAALNSNKNEISYISDRLSKQLRKHTNRVVDYVIHLEVADVFTTNNGILTKHQLPHIHGTIICSRTEFGDGNGHDKKFTVRNALKSINSSKQSKAFDNQETFNKHELRGDFEYKETRNQIQCAIGWSHYISKDAVILKSKAKKEEIHGKVKTLPNSKAKLFTATRNIRRNAENIYNEIKRGYDCKDEIKEQPIKTSPEDGALIATPAEQGLVSKSLQRKIAEWNRQLTDNPQSAQTIHAPPPKTKDFYELLNEL